MIMLIALVSFNNLQLISKVFFFVAKKKYITGSYHKFILTFGCDRLPSLCKDTYKNSIKRCDNCSTLDKITNVERPIYFSYMHYVKDKFKINFQDSKPLTRVFDTIAMKKFPVFTFLHPDICQTF